MGGAKRTRVLGWWALTFFLLVVVIGIIGVVNTANLLSTWLIILGLFTVATIVAGYGVTGLWRGAIIDERNKMSLSQLQLFLWTVVIVSAYVAVALANIVTGKPDPLAIAVPQQIWIVLGISATSLVGTPLIRSQKLTQTPADPAVAAGPRSGQPIKVSGVIIFNVTPDEADWSDLFEGEETGNGAHLDLGKIQMFYFTLVLVLAYAVAIGKTLQGQLPIHSLPDLDSSAIALLAVSHAGYLTNQLVPHTKTAT